MTGKAADKPPARRKTTTYFDMAERDRWLEAEALGLPAEQPEPPVYPRLPDSALQNQFALMPDEPPLGVADAVPDISKVVGRQPAPQKDPARFHFSGAKPSKHPVAKSPTTPGGSPSPLKE